jgi:hypothetical protein
MGRGVEFEPTASETARDFWGIFGMLTARAGSAAGIPTCGEKTVIMRDSDHSRDRQGVSLGPTLCGRSVRSQATTGYAP